MNEYIRQKSTGRSIEAEGRESLDINAEDLKQPLYDK